jgi:hypothetical protein
VEVIAANGDPKTTMDMGMTHKKHWRNSVIMPFNKPELTMARITSGR